MTKACEEGGICKSCGKCVDVLIPLRLLVETKGGMEMQLRHYCPYCFTKIVEEWDSGRDESKTGLWAVVWTEKQLESIEDKERYEVFFYEKLMLAKFEALKKDHSVTEVGYGELTSQWIRIRGKE